MSWYHRENQDFPICFATGKPFSELIQIGLMLGAPFMNMD